MKKEEFFVYSQFAIRNLRILTFGTFDDLHPGHLYVLRRASEHGDLHVVIARDENVMKIKGRAPLQNQEQRKQAVMDAFPSATVMLGNQNDFLAPVRDTKPDLIILGYDQRLPPGLNETDLPCPILRLEAFHPEIHKSTLRRAQGNKQASGEKG